MILRPNALRSRLCYVVKIYFFIKNSGINPRYEICYFSDKKFFLSLSPEIITPGITPDARGTEYLDTEPVGA